MRRPDDVPEGSCVHGHEMTPENTLPPKGRLRGKCRECNRLMLRGRRERVARKAGRELRPMVLSLGADGQQYDLSRFWGHVAKAGRDECWLWTGNLGEGGYGTYNGRGGAHRIAYQITVGAIGEGREVDHLCYVPACVNPAHLEAVTPEENVRRRVARQTHCKRGHAFTADNTYENRPQRACKTCARARASAQRAGARRLEMSA